MQAFQRDLPRFEKLSAQVLGVSSDLLATHEKFSKKHNLTFPLIADDGRLKELYGDGRITYVIDQQGTIRFIQKGIPENKELLKELMTLQ